MSGESTLMATAALVVPGGKGWWEDFYDALEAKDRVAAEALLTSDTTLRLANHPPVQGREAVLETMEHFWGTIERMHHMCDAVVQSGGTTVVESTVTYTRLDGSDVSIPASTHFERRDGLVAAQRIYVDLAPLHAVAAEVFETPDTDRGAA